MIVSGESMEPTLHAGDLVLTVRKRAYEVGDVVAYRIPEGQPGAGVLVIHRIVGGSARAGYITQGDNRDGRDPWRPRPSDVVGAKGVSVPRVGLALVYLRTPLGLAALAGIVAGLLVLGGSTTNGPQEGADARRSPRPRCVAAATRARAGSTTSRLGDRSPPPTLPLPRLPRRQQPLAAKSRDQRSPAR